MGYEVFFIKSDDGITSICTCRQSFCCEHQLTLLKGDTTGCVGGVENMEELQQWVKKFNVSPIITKIDSQKAALKQARKELRRYKTKVTLLTTALSDSNDELAKIFNTKEVSYEK